MNLKLCISEKCPRAFKTSLVELPYISCKKPAEVDYIRHYVRILQIPYNSDKTCQVVRSDIYCRFSRFLQDSCRSLHLDGSCKTMTENCKKVSEMYGKHQDCFVSFTPIGHTTFFTVKIMN